MELPSNQIVIKSARLRKCCALFEKNVLELFRGSVSVYSVALLPLQRVSARFMSCCDTANVSSVELTSQIVRFKKWICWLLV